MLNHSKSTIVVSLARDSSDSFRSFAVFLNIGDVPGRL